MKIVFIEKKLTSFVPKLRALPMFAYIFIPKDDGSRVLNNGNPLLGLIIFTIKSVPHKSECIWRDCPAGSFSTIGFLSA